MQGKKQGQFGMSGRYDKWVGLVETMMMTADGSQLADYSLCEPR
jgi:hypothetical protein